MASTYVVNFTDPTKLPFSVPAGSIDGPGEVNVHTSLKIHGQGATSYGENINENFVKLLENFANTTPPPFPIQGQTWYDSNTSQLKVFSGTAWTVASNSFAGCPAPPGAVSGQLWYDQCGVEPNTLRIYDGTAAAFQSVGFRYLLREGDTATDHDNFMTGNLDMDSNRIINIANPVNSGDAVPFGFADARYVNIPGDIMTGRLDVTGATDPTGISVSRTTGPTVRIANTNPVGDNTTRPPGLWLVNPDNDQAKGATAGPNTLYGYAAWSFADQSLLSVTGHVSDGNLTTTGGTLILNVKQDGNIDAPLATVTESTHLTTKQYVDTSTASLQSQVTTLSTSVGNVYDKPTSDARFVRKAGDTMAGNLHLAGTYRLTGIPAGNPAVGDEAVSFNFTEGRYVKKAGDVMTGPLFLANNGIPSVPNAVTAISAYYAQGAYASVNPSLFKDGDISFGVNSIFINFGGLPRQIWPAQFS